MLNLIKRFLAGLFLLFCSINISAQNNLPAITPDDYSKWQTLGPYSVSDDGSWVSWGVSLLEGDDTLLIKNAVTGKLYKYPLSSGNIFSSDSRWAASRIGYSEKQTEKLTEQKKPIKYKARLLNLQSGTIRVFDNIESFSFTKDAGHFVMAGYNGDSKTKDIFLYNLKTGTTKNISNVSEFSVNKPGSLLAYIISAENKKGNGVELMSLYNYSISFLSNDTSIYRDLVWEKEGNDLMFLKAYADTSHVEENHKVYIVRNISTKPDIKVFDPESDTLILKGLRVKETYKPSVSDDHRILFFGAYDWTKKGKKEKKSTAENQKLPAVDIWHWKDDPIQPRQKNTFTNDRNFTYLVAWDIDKNKITRINDDTMRQVMITGDGHNAVISDDTPYKPSFRQPVYNHYIVNTATGNKKMLIENFTSLTGASPGGKYILYFKDQNWWVYDIYKGVHKNLTLGIESSFWNTRDDSPNDIKPPVGVGGWMKDDKALLVYDEYDVWKINMDGSKPQRLTNGKENKIIYRVYRLDTEYPYLDPAKDLYFSAFGDLTKESGYYRLTSNNKLEKLIFENKSVSGLRKAEKSDFFVFRYESYSVSPNIYRVAGSFSDPRKISDTNPQQAMYAWGRSELVNFTNHDGRKLQGALYYPANFEQGKKYPMIVYIYEIRSNNVNRYETPSPRSPYNVTNYTSQGYFIFQPDIVYKTNHPGESAVNCVVPAVEEVIKTGMIDEKKIGIMGHSWGAYQTSFIITQTDLFSAAVAGAPLIDMISMYNEIYWNTGGPNQNIFETSQGRLREPWWIQMDDYISNSPMFQAGNIKTPLLVAFGTSDGAVDWHQGIEMYTTMRRMQKPYIMLVYDSENHSLAKKENQLDYAKKVNQFFNHYLKGGEPEEWITNGKKYLEKKLEEEKAGEKKQ
jgi:dipeptidyl aminopeptidase/acylaminoacyl peptidase